LEAAREADPVTIAAVLSALLMASRRLRFTKSDSLFPAGDTDDDWRGMMGRDVVVAVSGRTNDEEYPTRKDAILPT